ncbi:heavy-metal-associated domain-containing protein [Allomuricauda sp. d1]|uniref:heavy-metal-associated domain-containing protein n=1 Tax=Allomuricauda sp. d1 TaxID=3136725 RepID=UPI0031D9BF79
MKKTIILTLAFGMMAVFANAQKAMDQFMVQVDGLGCPFCAYGLEKKFKEFKGIKDVKIDIETGDFSFSYPSEKSLTLTDVETQVEKAGYTPITAKVERANGEVEVAGGETTMTKDNAMVKETVKVAGNCGMCEARIVKAAKDVDGVGEASWNKDTKMLQVSFDSTATSLTAIEKAIATKGHDTENHQAHTDDYGNLPGCCQYERLEY